MRNMRLCIYCILAVAVTLLYIRCMDEPLFNAEHSPSSAEPENKTLRAMKQCFEENATTLKQVHANLAYNPHTRSGKEAPTNCCAAHTRGNASKGTVNIVPQWDCARLWEGEKKIYAEVPLKGKGMHFAAYVQSGNKKKVYLANNLLMLTQDKENGEIHYYVVTALANLSKYGPRPKREKLFQFVGNPDFDGIAIYSRTDGTFTKALHIHDGKSHPIFFGKPSPATRATGGATDTDTEGSIVTLTSELSNYDGAEIGGGVQGEIVCKCSPCLCIDCPGNKTYCAICGNYYDITLDTCPNNCDVVITPGGDGGGGGNTGGGGWIPNYKTCPYCYLQYDPMLNSCPFGCEDRCSKCGQNPCQCKEDVHRCERCGSSSCPGPWYCGAGGGEGNSEKEYKITLWINPTGAVDLGSQYTLTVMNASYPATRIVSIEYIILHPQDIVGATISKTVSTNITHKAYSPGYWKIRAVATFEDGGTATSNTLDLTIQNPLYSDIMNSSTVNAKMNALWAAAVQDALNDPPVYHEKGCIIYFNTTDNSYEFEDVPDSNEFECEGITEIHFEFSTNRGYPDRGGRYPVATFHTHPARTKCDELIGYEVGPSKVDKKMNTVCLLYDYEGNRGEIYGGHSAKDSYKLYHCALERHPLE